MQMIISQSNQQPIRAYMLSYHGKNLHACMRRHSTCPKNRVNLRPTTQCKCQWEINTELVPTPISQPVVYVIFIYLFRVFFGNRTFRGLTAGLLHPPTFFGLHRWIRCLTRFSGFSPEGGIYPLLATLDTFHFPFSFNIVELNWTSSHSQAHTIQHQTQCQINTMNTLSCNVVLPHTNAMQFVPLHSNP